MPYKRRGVWLIVPGLAGFLFFYMIPFVYSFYYAVIDNAFNLKFVGISNFIEVVQNKYYILALKNTFEFTVTGVPLLIALSFILAVLVSSQTKKLQFIRAAFVIPILIPSAAVIMIWQVLFGENGFLTGHIAGVISGFMEEGAIKLPIYLFFIWKNTGFNMILFIAGLLSIPAEIYEASQIDGAGTIKRHIYITLPLLMPATFFILVISTVNSLKIFKEIFLLYGAYPNESIYVVQHYMNNHFNKLNYQNLTTGAIIFALIVYIIVLIGYRVENRINREVW